MIGGDRYNRMSGGSTAAGQSGYSGSMPTFAKATPAKSSFSLGGGGGGGPTWHGATAARQEAGKSVAGPGFGKGAYWAEGGRVGYKTGGRVGILSVF